LLINSNAYLAVVAYLGGDDDLPPPLPLGMEY